MSGLFERGRVHTEIDGGRVWEAQTVARVDGERWSEYGVGSLNSESEEWRLIREEEVQEGNKRLEEKEGWRKKRVYCTHTVEYI